MNTLIELLRAPSNGYPVSNAHALMAQAATEIERLRAELDDVQGATQVAVVDPLKTEFERLQGIVDKDAERAEKFQQLVLANDYQISELKRLQAKVAEQFKEIERLQAELSWIAAAEAARR